MNDGSTWLVTAGEWREHMLPTSNPVWSPDVTSFAYITVVPPANTPVIWRARADGSNAIKLFDPGPTADYGLILAGWYNDQILFWTDPSFSGSILADGVPLMAVPATGGQPRTIIPRMLAYSDFLNIAPDRQHLVVTVGDNRAIYSAKYLEVMSLASGQPSRLTDATTAATTPTWSPDGQYIAYVAVADRGDVPVSEAIAARRIWVMNRDGSNKHQVTNDAAYQDDHPGWLADSELIFVRIDQSHQASLWIVNANGSSPKRITDTLGPVPSVGNWMEWPGFYGYMGWDRYFDVFAGI